MVIMVITIIVDVVTMIIANMVTMITTGTVTFDVGIATKITESEMTVMMASC